MGKAGAKSRLTILKSTRKSASASNQQGRADIPYPEFLRSRIRETEASKGQRTRGALLVAASELLEQGGYRNLRVTDINERGGVSNALFYTYFKNKDEISREVMTGFLSFLYDYDDFDGKPQSLEESIYRTNLLYVRRFAANPGLMRCLLQFGDQIKEFSSLWRESSQVWLRRVVGKMSREPALVTADVDAIWMTVSALGTMVDGLLRLIYIDLDPMTRLHGKRLLQEPQELARFLTELWLRGLFGKV